MKMVFWAGVGTLFPFLMTTLGAALVFLMKKQSEDGPCMGLCGGRDERGGGFQHDFARDAAE